MNCTDRCWPRLALLSAALVLSGTLPGAQAQTDRATAFRQGTHAFRRILFDTVGQKLEPLTSMDEIDADPPHTLLIVLGEIDAVGRDPFDLKKFVKSGGALLVATDRTIPQRQLPFDYHVHFYGIRVALRGGGEQDGYRGSPECPFVQPVPSSAVPVFQGLSRVATNRPGLLLQPFPDFAGLPALAKFPAACQPPDEVWVHPRFFPLWFAAGGKREKGRVLLLADHSVFINDMVAQTDNDNFQFAFNCADWLTESGLRHRVLLFDEGVAQTEFNIPVRDLPPNFPSLGAILYAVNRGLQGLDEENVFNEMIQNRLDQADPLLQARLLRSTLLMLSLAVALYGLARIGMGRHRFEPGASLDTLLARQAPAGVVAELRHREMVLSGNLWEPARALARQWFDTALGTQLVGLERRARHDRMPLLRVRVRGGWWRRWTMGRQVRRLWKLAQDPTPFRVSSRRFARMTHLLNELNTARAEGVLRFEIPEN